MRSSILRREVRYCALLPASYDSVKTRRYPVLYLLHGLGDNEQMLVRSGVWNIVERLRETGSIADFLIVTPQADRSYYVNSHNGSVFYEDFFIREFVTAIERRYRVRRTRASRGIAGISMGGYGALRFAFKYPQMFAAVGAHMPALYETVPPFIRAAAAISPRAARLDIGNVFGAPFDEKFWERESPFTLLRANAAHLRQLKIYFDCGDQDDFGFDAGARSLDRLLSAKGIAHEFHIYPGRHDWMHVVQHFPQMLEFESKAIAGQEQRTSSAK
ncbi:MAG: alpha/beta hydrolase [Terriglobales bacterium]